MTSTESSGNMKGVFTRFYKGLRRFEETIKEDGHEFMCMELMST